MNIKNLSSKAFTIVELAVIIAVIGILAGINTIGYGSWRQGLAKKEVESDLRQAASAMELSKHFNNGYPTYILGQTPTNYKGSPNVSVKYKSGTSVTYCLEGTSNLYSTTVIYHISAGDSDPKVAGC